MNLLSNAIKYNQPAGRVDVTSEVVDEERVRIVVADTGPGIDDARIERLFVPFERLDMDRGTIEGTGLGLALSRSLAEAMDGTIGVRSEPGSGSSFWLELKRSLPPKRAGTVAAGVAEGRVRPGAGTILYIEDNPSNLRLVQRVLAQRRPGLALLSAMDGKSGIAMAQERQPDLIFLDLNLPDKPGEEVLRRLWADQQTREIPVIVLSADATRSTSQRLIAAGARAYLTKPIDVPRLIALVDERFCQ
jgi:CheY-like chemotaxis protein